MKIRIKGNSVRLRLSKTDLKTLSQNNSVIEKTFFPNAELIYVLEPSQNSSTLTATFIDNKITVFIPQTFSEIWNDNNIVSIDARQINSDGNELYLLAEKDFQCLDKTSEDQTDYFINPNTTCK